MAFRSKLSPAYRYRLLLAAVLTGFLCCLPSALFDVPYATVVTDRNGRLLGARIATDGQWRFPPADTVPERYATCLVAFEDRRFYHHNGVDPLAVIRAAIQNIRGRRVVSGGSTLTMQTIRLARNKRRTAVEKLLEALLAVRLEYRYSKRGILALYASHAPFGGNVVGIDAAAWRYFGHSAAELSWAEAATLAVLPNAPALMHPGRNREALMKKRNRLIEHLCREGKIDRATADLALAEPLPDQPLPLPLTAPHLVADIEQRRRGERVRSTIDGDLQQQVEAVLARWHAQFSRSDIRDLAAIVIDVPANRVAAYCGNVGFDDLRARAGQVDIIRSRRSTGSILKPFLYCASLAEGHILPRTLLPDVPLNVNGFVPQNFNMQYDGAVPASEVIARSLNIPSVALLRQYGVPQFCDYLRRAGFTTIDRAPSDYGLSLILGGAEATLWDVAFAYTDMARALQGLERLSGTAMADEPQRPLPAQFQPGAVWQVFDAIKEVNRPEEIDWRMVPSMQTVAWKTGTSYGFRDAWAAGVTPRYAVVVWVGNASGEGKAELVGARTAGPVMFDIFNLLPRSNWFVRPEGAFVEAEVCRRSGHLKGRYCGDETDTMLIVPAGLRSEACPYHTPVTLTPDGAWRVYENCVEAGQPVVHETRFVLPPVWEWYYRQHHPEYRPLPPFLPGCMGDVGAPMAFIYPQQHTRIYLPRQLDGSEGVLTCELAHSDPSATVFWHLDADYLGATTDFHKFTFRPSPGRHSITVVDDRGNTLSTTVEISAERLK